MLTYCDASQRRLFFVLLSLFLLLLSMQCNKCSGRRLPPMTTVQDKALQVLLTETWQNLTQQCYCASSVIAHAASWALLEAHVVPGIYLTHQLRHKTARQSRTMTQRMISCTVERQ